MINKVPGYPHPKTPPTPASVDAGRQQTATHIRRGTAQRLGLHQPGRWADDMTRSTTPGWGDGAWSTGGHPGEAAWHATRYGPPSVHSGTYEGCLACVNRQDTYGPKAEAP